MPAADEAATSDEQRRARVSVRAILAIVLVAVGVLVLDQFVKYLVVTNLEPQRLYPVIGELLQLYFVTNSGAAFSLASGFTWLLSVVAVVVIVLIIWFARRIRSVAWGVMLGLFLGGALGNLVDRLFREPGFAQGHVVDFIRISFFPAIFNIADIAVVTGAGLLILLVLLGVGIDGRRHRSRGAEPDEGAASVEAAADDEA